MRTSLEVADIFRSAGSAYRAAHAGHLSLGQLKVMAAIENCRTAALGGHVDACDDCGHWRIAYNSCLMGKIRNGELVIDSVGNKTPSPLVVPHKSHARSMAINLSGALKDPLRR